MGCSSCRRLVTGHYGCPPAVGDGELVLFARGGNAAVLILSRRRPLAGGESPPPEKLRPTNGPHAGAAEGCRSAAGDAQKFKPGPRTRCWLLSPPLNHVFPSHEESSLRRRMEERTKAYSLVPVPTE